MLRRLRSALEASDFSAHGDLSALMAIECVKPVSQLSGPRPLPVVLACCCDTNGGGFIANRTIGA